MSWQKSVNNVVLFNFFNNISFERVLWVVYLLNKNISLIEVGIIQSILNISMFIFEFPTGYVGDRYGRRNSLFIGNIMIIVYLSIFLVGSKFYQFCIGSVFYGIGMTFISGSNEALLYDNLKKLGQIDKYNTLLSKINFISVLGLLVSIYLGGIIEKISLSFIFIAGIIFRIISCIFLFFIIEYPYLAEEQKPVFIDIQASIKFIKINKTLLYFILTSSLFISFFSVYVLFGQEILRNNGEKNLYNISIIYMCLYSLSGVISLFYDRLVKMMKENFLVLANNFVIFILLVFTIYGTSNFYIAIFIIVGALYEINDLTYNIVINDLAVSNLRARIFSMYSLVITIFMSLFSILVTYLLSNKSVYFNKYFFILATIILFISWYGIFITKKSKKI